MSAAGQCQGHEGESACDGQGVMFSCGPNAEVQGSQHCESVRHCQQGLASGTCSSCIAGEDYRCTGANLEACAASGDGFNFVKACETEALCNETVRDCSMATCAPNAFSCNGNTLRQCNAGGDGFAMETACLPGRCDSAAGLCRVCDPGVSRCQGSAVVTCNAAGTQESRQECTGATPICFLAKCVVRTGACSADGRTICDVFGATCEHRSELSGNEYDLCRWNLASTEQLCATTRGGIWTTPDSGFAQSTPGLIPEGSAGVCASTVGNLDCSAANAAVCARFGATCDKQPHVDGSSNDTCRWALATTERACNGTDGIWTAIESTFATNNPYSVPAGRAGACITVVQNLQ